MVIITCTVLRNFTFKLFDEIFYVKKGNNSLKK